jgi:hypothetical protein
MSKITAKLCPVVAEFAPIAATIINSAVGKSGLACQQSGKEPNPQHG